MIRNIIFDWSGTLVDDLPAVWEATNHVFAQSGIAPLSLEQFRAEFALPFTFPAIRDAADPWTEAEALCPSKFSRVGLPTG